jgi:hypothetical protein
MLESAMARAQGRDPSCPSPREGGAATAQGAEVPTVQGQPVLRSGAAMVPVARGAAATHQPGAVEGGDGAATGAQRVGPQPVSE